MSDSTAHLHEEDLKPNDPAVARFTVVGIGASAGGLKPLQTFFDHMPSDSGMAFVVVMHLAPDYASNLAQILRHHTGMKVTQVTESVTVEPNRVYVIPPNHHLAARDGKLFLVEPQQPPGLRVAIDLFFRTVSVAFGPRAVCVVLSGADSDGAIGIKHVKEQGGVTIVQDPTEAEHESMPRSAMATGMVDWVLPVADMPGRLIQFVQNETRMHVPPDEPQEGETPEADNRNAGGPLTVQQVPSVTDEEALQEVMRFLNAQTGHDFSHYKRATVLRRVARRLQVNLLETIPAYLEFLRTHAAETPALLHDLLISVTNFFRDSEAFAALEIHMPQMFAGKEASEQVRVWVAGCATGEEAYSIAILLYEHASRLTSPPAIQVFATDIDDEVIHYARAGLFPATIEADVSAERLRRFFQKDQGRYRIRKEIREIVLFSPHNLLKDPPFSRLDLTTCRNLLIYLKREAQERVFDTFHYALRPGGLLFLGGSESVDDSHILFVPLDKRHRIFARRAVARPNGHIIPMPFPSTLQRAVNAPVLPRPFPSSSEPVESAVPPPAFSSELRTMHFSEMHFALLEQMAPPSVLINAAYDIVHLSEHAGQFLQFVGGEPSANLTTAIHPALRVELRATLFRASRSGMPTTASHVPMTRDGMTRLIDIHVRPVPPMQTGQGYLLVLFEAVEAVNGSPGVIALSSEQITRDLEEEIQELKTLANSTSEQYEASTEELKASNEELQAMNEELRSATEELETGKEELQSINEELTTVNHELKSSVEQVNRVNSDLQNLMASTDIGTIFLGRQLQIKRFTPRVQELFNMIPTDIGRPLSDITHKLNYPALTEDAERVLHDLRPNEREVSSNDSWFLARMLPYRTVDDRIDGVVLTFVDITTRKHTEDIRVGLEQDLAVLAERNRMAQELHDTLAQGFTAIKLQMDAAELALQGNPAEVQVRIARCREIALQSVQEARRSITALHSPLIDQGLAAALQQLADQTTNGIKVACTILGTAYTLPARTENELYRIGQEALTNALRHSHATHINLEIAYSPKEVRLRVTDDGLGFDQDLPNDGFGISGMRDRASRIGGRFTIENPPGRGSVVMVVVAAEIGLGDSS
ncbi:MAG: signal transduction histidine kinase with CheB and CheR [Chthonomonadaceae bacterium]|nr:signal transduction histidine kinase with CheB and CheR [Chthonomonadaceae bacterium]